MNAELIWAAGLFAGEGACFVVTRKDRKVINAAGETVIYKGGNKYLNIAVLMTDERSVRRFRDALLPHAVYLRKTTPRSDIYNYIPSSRPGAKRVYKWGLVNTPAVSVMRALYPHLEGTDKGDQVKACFDELGLDL